MTTTNTGGEAVQIHILTIEAEFCELKSEVEVGLIQKLNSINEYLIATYSEMHTTTAYLLSFPLSIFVPSNNTNNTNLFKTTL